MRSAQAAFPYFSGERLVSLAGETYLLTFDISRLYIKYFIIKLYFSPLWGKEQLNRHNANRYQALSWFFGFIHYYSLIEEVLPIINIDLLVNCCVSMNVIYYSI